MWPPKLNEALNGPCYDLWLAEPRLGQELIKSRVNQDFRFCTNVAHSSGYSRTGRVGEHLRD